MWKREKSHRDAEFEIIFFLSFMKSGFIVKETFVCWHFDKTSIKKVWNRKIRYKVDGLFRNKFKPN